MPRAEEPGGIYSYCLKVLLRSLAHHTYFCNKFVMYEGIGFMKGIEFMKKLRVLIRFMKELVSDHEGIGFVMGLCS